jgi:hypothetical protein
METPGAMPTWAASAQIAMMIIISSNTAVGIWPRHQLVDLDVSVILIPHLFVIIL